MRGNAGTSFEGDEKCVQIRVTCLCGEFAGGHVEIATHNGVEAIRIGFRFRSSVFKVTIVVCNLQHDDDLWFVTLSLTPMAMKYFVHSENTISFECRIQNVVTRISFNTDQLICLNGLNGKELVDTQPFQYLIHEEALNEQPEPPVKKRPSLSVVKND